MDAEVAAEQALERKSAELASKLRTSLTAAVVAHEINQPLSMILLQAQLALNSARQIGPAADPLQAALASLIAEGERVVTTIERMRMLLRNVATPHAPLDLAMVVENAVLYMRHQASQQGVELSSSAPPQALPVAGDAVQLQQAIANLIRNSLEALAHPAGGSGGRILLSATRLAEAVELRVADNGPGFGDLRLADLPLTTSKHRGMGLGLFVVQTTIANHGGTVALGRSALGGAEVLLRLPLLRV
jgi:signal transduction histidine kinase